MRHSFAWMSVFESAIAAQTRVWGGSANLVFPLAEDLEQHELLWSLLDLFDPDLLLTYVGAVADLEQFDPDRWAELTQSWELDLAGFGPGAREDYLEEARRHPLFGEELDEEFLQLARRRLAVLHGEAGPSPPWVSEHGPPPYPLTDVTRLREVQKISPIRDITTGEGALGQLLLTVEVGRLSASLRTEIEALELSIDLESLDGYAWRQELFRRETPRAGFPWTIAELGVRWGTWRPPQRDAVPLVVGSDPWDFTLFYALRRLRSVAYWLPDELQADENFVRDLRSALDWASLTWGGRVVVVSATADSGQRESALARVRDVPNPRRPISIAAADWRSVLQAEPSRLYEQDGEGRPVVVAQHQGRVDLLPTPIPRAITADTSNDVRWMTELRDAAWPVIRHSELGPKVIEANGYDTNYVRVSRYGPAYFSPNWLTLGGVSLESNVVRPTWARRPLHEQLKAALAARDWKVEQSNKGVFAEETAAKFGGFDQLVEALRDDVMRTCIDSYLPGRNIGMELKIDQRSYLEMRDFAREVGRTQAILSVAELERRGVLARGVVLKCERCRSASWYGLDALSDQFVCRRCDRRQRATRERWVERDEPHWRYRLDEVVYQFLKEHGEVPVLALARFLSDSETPVDVAYEMRFTSPEGTVSEIDIVAARGFELVLGEATTSDRYASGGEPTRLRELREIVLTAEARHVLLATSQPSFHATTRTRAQATFPMPGPRLTILDAVS
jgi:hypothetical protein